MKMIRSFIFQPRFQATGSRDNQSNKNLPKNRSDLYIVGTFGKQQCVVTQNIRDFLLQPRFHAGL